MKKRPKNLAWKLIIASIVKLDARLVHSSSSSLVVFSYSTQNMSAENLADLLTVLLHIHQFKTLSTNDTKLYLLQTSAMNTILGAP